MKIFYFFIILFLFQSCSFVNKTGIWKNENSDLQKNNETFNEFKKLSIKNEIFDKIIPIQSNNKFTLTKPIKAEIWTDIFYNQTNNLNNFSYKELNQISFKSKKLTKNQINDYIIFKDQYIFLNDSKGNIIIFSINDNELILKFNFYKKKYKKIKKYLNFIVENNIIYISDNLGYLYAFDYYKKKIIWAKNYKIPFRSNLKITKDKLITSNQNNNLYFFNKYNGDVLTSIPTEETIIKNQFKNNLSLDKENLYYLNTFGSLYSINLQNSKVNWFLNLADSLNINSSNLFIGSKIIYSENKVIVSSNNFTYIINSKTGTIDYKFNFTALVKPIVIDKYLFLITNNNLLITMNKSNGKIIFSSDINQDISDYLKVKKYKVQIKNISILQSKIYIFLQNSYYLKYNLNGKLIEIRKLPSKINSYPIFVENSIFYLNDKNKLIKID